MHALRTALFVYGYPVSIIVIIRWIPVVRQRRVRWFVLHQLAVAAIVAGWAISHDWRAVVINGSWLIAAALWFWRGARRALVGAE